MYLDCYTMSRAEYDELILDVKLMYKAFMEKFQQLTMRMESVEEELRESRGRTNTRGGENNASYINMEKMKHIQSHFDLGGIMTVYNLQIAT